MATYTEEEAELLSNGDSIGAQILTRWEDAHGFKRGRTLHRSPEFYDVFAEDIAKWTEETEGEEATDAIDIHRFLLVSHRYIGKIDSELVELISELRKEFEGLQA